MIEEIDEKRFKEYIKKLKKKIIYLNIK